MVRKLEHAFAANECANAIKCCGCCESLAFDESDIQYECIPVDIEEWKYYGSIICPYCSSETLVCVDGGNKLARYNLLTFYKILGNNER